MFAKKIIVKNQYDTRKESKKHLTELAVFYMPTFADNNTSYA